MRFVDAQPHEAAATRGQRPISIGTSSGVGQRAAQRASRRSARRDMVSQVYAVRRRGDGELPRIVSPLLGHTTHPAHAAAPACRDRAISASPTLNCASVRSRTGLRDRDRSSARSVDRPVASSTNATRSSARGRLRRTAARAASDRGKRKTAHRSVVADRRRVGSRCDERQPRRAAGPSACRRRSAAERVAVKSRRSGRGVVLLERCARTIEVVQSARNRCIPFTTGCRCVSVRYIAVDVLLRRRRAAPSAPREPVGAPAAAGRSTGTDGSGSGWIQLSAISADGNDRREPGAAARREPSRVNARAAAADSVRIAGIAKRAGARIAVGNIGSVHQPGVRRLDTGTGAPSKRRLRTEAAARTGATRRDAGRTPNTERRREGGRGPTAGSRAQTASATIGERQRLEGASDETEARQQVRAPRRRRSEDERSLIATRTNAIDTQASHSARRCEIDRALADAPPRSHRAGATSRSDRQPRETTRRSGPLSPPRSIPTAPSAVTRSTNELRSAL